MPDFFDVALRQRACRAFASDPVPEDLVARVLTTATHAPSAENRQPWVFVVVRDPVLREAIGDIMRQVWEGGARQHSAGRLPGPLLEEVERGATGGLGSGVAAAPVMVTVCGDSHLGLAETLPSSVYLAVQNLLLAATALGLGSVMTSLATISPAPLRQLLDLPDHVHPMAVVPLGWPARPQGPPRRAPLSSRAHRERYGSGW